MKNFYFSLFFIFNILLLNFKFTYGECLLSNQFELPVDELKQLAEQASKVEIRSKALEIKFRQEENIRALYLATQEGDYAKFEKLLSLKLDIDPKEILSLILKFSPKEQDSKEHDFLGILNLFEKNFRLNDLLTKSEILYIHFLNIIGLSNCAQSCLVKKGTLWQ